MILIKIKLQHIMLIMHEILGSNIELQNMLVLTRSSLIHLEKSYINFTPHRRSKSEIIL